MEEIATVLETARRDQCLALRSTKQLWTVVASWDENSTIMPWGSFEVQQLHVQLQETERLVQEGRYYVAS